MSAERPVLTPEILELIAAASAPELIPRPKASVFHLFVGWHVMGAMEKMQTIKPPLSREMAMIFAGEYVLKKIGSLPREFELQILMAAMTEMNRMWMEQKQP